MSVCAKCHDLFHAYGTESGYGTEGNEGHNINNTGNISPITVSTFSQKPEVKAETKIKKTRIRKKTTNGYTLF